MRHRKILVSGALLLTYNPPSRLASGWAYWCGFFSPLPESDSDTESAGGPRSLSEEEATDIIIEGLLSKKSTPEFRV